ncbi:MAG: serine/threonine-protein phosphatase [Bacteroidales bacterium]|nr:serine/threonine-protein phosphatase [Bacteroidales bacterium]
MKITATYLSLWELGQRTNQEDSIYPSFGQKIPNNDLFILCDGMGGHDCGEVASQTVCQAMSSYILAHPDTDFESALDAAYDALDAKDNNAEKKMGTTLTFVKFDEGQCIVAHIGDSRVYQIRPSEKRVVYVTRDHSLVNDLIACGELTPEEAKHSNQKNVITRAMQPHQEHRTKADVAILTDIRAGDYFYMCSDGMLEISEDEDIVNVLSMDKTDEQKLSILKGVTRDNKDNHSCHLIHVTAIEGSIEATNQGSKRHLFVSKRILLYAVAIIAILCSILLLSKRLRKPVERVLPIEEEDTTITDTPKILQEETRAEGAITTPLNELLPDTSSSNGGDSCNKEDNSSELNQD